MKKYGQMQPKDSKWCLPLIHSGIIHCDEFVSKEKEEIFNPYNVLYNQGQFTIGLSNQTSHRYGSIYVLPSQVHVFKNWFRMIFEYHFKEYRSCWSCGERNHVSIRQLVTLGGNPKYHILCKTCNEFWVKVHCRQHGHHLVKHTLNYHLQVKNQNKNRWFVVCPTCRDGA